MKDLCIMANCCVAFAMRVRSCTLIHFLHPLTQRLAFHPFCRKSHNWHKFYLFWTFSIVTILVVAPAGAPRAQVPTFTLDACVEYALAHSSQMQLAKASAEEAAANYREAIGRLLPDLNASTSAYLNFGRGIDPKTNAYTNTNSFSNRYGLESSLLLFDGLGSVYRLLGAREEKQIGLEEQLREEQRVRMATVEAYYNLLYCKELERLAKGNLSNSIRLTQQTARMQELGMKALTDVAEARATEATDRQTLIARSKQYAVALLQLKAAMNYPIETPLTIVDSLSYGAVAPTLLSAEEVFSSALNHLPDARIAALQLRSSRYQYQSSLGNFSPKIHLVAGLGSSFSFFTNDHPHDPFWQQLRDRQGAYIGATLSLSLFSRLQNSAQTQRAKARLLAQEAKSADEKRKIYAEVQETILELNGSAEAYQAAVEIEAHRKQVYEATLRNYQIGHASALDLSMNAARHKEAKAEVAHCYALYLLQQEKLFYYSGYKKE